MAANRNNTGIFRSWPWWRWIMTGLNTVAMVISAILSWHYLMGGSMAGCGGGSPCDQVLNSPWSSLAGVIPVSGLALGVYLALLLSSFFIGPDTELQIRKMAWTVMLVLAGSVAGSAVWFTIIQKWFIGEFCPYCMTAHISGLLLASLIIWRALKEPAGRADNTQKKKQAKTRIDETIAERRLIRPKHVAGLAFSGLTVAVIMASFQAAFNPPVVYSEGESQNTIPAIDYNAVPLAGSPDAPYIVTILFDYQCAHCQKLHFMLNEAIQRYNGKLAFVLCPTPLNTGCNPYIPQDVDAFKYSCELARIAMAVWVAGRESFADFENYMFTFDSGDSWKPRSPESARARAVELVGQAKFDAAFADPWIDQYMKTCVQYYGQTLQGGRGGVPKLIYKSLWVIPELQNTDELVMLLQNSLAIPRPSEM